MNRAEKVAACIGKFEAVQVYFTFSITRLAFYNIYRKENKTQEKFVMGQKYSSAFVMKTISKKEHTS